MVDADPTGSALEWSDLAAMDPRIALRETFPFRVVALPSRELHRRLPEIARDDDVVIIDTPQIEDRVAITRSALRYADEIVIPVRAQPARDQPHHAGPGRDRRGRPGPRPARPLGHLAEPLHHPRALGIRCPPRADRSGL